MLSMTIVLLRSKSPRAWSRAADLPCRKDTHVSAVVMSLKRRPCKDHPVEKAQVLLVRMTDIESLGDGVLNATPGFNEGDETLRRKRQPQRVRIHQSIEGSPECDVELHAPYTGNLDRTSLEENE